MDFKRKRIILIAGILFLAGITASIIKFMPPKSMNSAEKVRPQENNSKQAVQIAPSSRTENNTDLSNKKTTATTNKINSSNPQRSEDDAVRDKESQEGKVEREEAYKDDTPEKAQKRASLEKEIRTLSQAKEKEEKELSTLISSLDEAQQNSQLPPEELQKKQAEIKTIKLLLMRTYGDKLSTIDSSLQEKLQQYRDVTTEKTDPEGIVDLD
jgi:hypothetical protein